MFTVYETLRELGATGKKIITLLNKQDKTPETGIRDLKADYTVKCSARTGEGLDEVQRSSGRSFWRKSRSIWRNYILTAKPARFRKSVNSEVFYQKNIVRMEFCEAVCQQNSLFP